MDSFLDSLESFIAKVKQGAADVDAAVQEGCDAGVGLLEFVRSAAGKMFAAPGQAGRLAKCRCDLEECSHKCSAPHVVGAVNIGQIVQAVLALLSIFFPARPQPAAA